MSAVLQRGWLTAEDEALKAKLSGIMVDNGSGAMTNKVHVIYRNPSDETQQIFPCIIISMIDIIFASERNHSSEIVIADYWPSEWPTIAEYCTARGLAYDPALQTPMATRWQPYDIIYQVETRTRSLVHDRQITATLHGTAYLPKSGWGFLHVPVDGSERWLDVEGYVQADYIDGAASSKDKRVFRKIWTVKVSSFLPPENPFIFYDVQRVAGNIIAIEGDVIDAPWNTP